MKPSYRQWSNAIGQAIFSAQEAGRVVYLAIDDEEIGRIGREFGLDPAPAYDCFREVVSAEVRSDWSFPDRPLQVGEFPAYLGVLAAQVVAAFQMHDSGLTGATAYWRRLREFLGQSSEDNRPEGLEAWEHKQLWKGLERWANEINGGQLGRMRLVDKIGGHHLVAEPLGQCLLRRADLAKLRELFVERGRPDLEPLRGRRLRELVDEARSLPGRYFTKHSGRVLDDADRFEDAWEQIEAEYERFLAEKCPAAAPRARPPTAGVWRQRPGTIVRLQIVRKRLSGGLYSRGYGPLSPVITEVEQVLRRCYLRAGHEGSKPPHKPPHDDFLLASRDDDLGAFAETSTCRAGDDVLLLVPDVFGQAWLDDADPGLFDGAPRKYRPSVVDRLEWEPLEGLPAGWLALRFKTRGDLSDVTLNGKWIGVVDRRATSLRAVGGLTLRRGVWMLGAGPTVHVVGPGIYDHVLVDDDPHPLDASRSATPDLVAGKHHVRLPGQASRSLRLQILEPRCAAPRELGGWHWVEGGWPASVAERRRIEWVPGSGTLHGAQLVGDWPAHRQGEPSADLPELRTLDEAIPDELAAMILAVDLRFGGQSSLRRPRLLAAAQAAATRSANPLLRGMLRAGHSAVSSWADKA